MIKKEKNENEFLKGLHDKYYGKRKRRLKIKEENKKQMWLFDASEEKKDN